MGERKKGGDAISEGWELVWIHNRYIHTHRSTNACIWHHVHRFDKFCMEPTSFTVKEESQFKGGETEFVKTKLMTRLTYTLDQVREGGLQQQQFDRQMGRGAAAAAAAAAHVAHVAHTHSTCCMCTHTACASRRACLRAC